MKCSEFKKLLESLGCEIRDGSITGSPIARAIGHNRYQGILARKFTKDYEKLS